MRGWLAKCISEIASLPEECCRSPGRDFTRSRKLALGELVRLIVTMGAGSVGHELADHFSWDPAAIPSKSAFCQQRPKLLHDAMLALLRSFATRLGLLEWRDGLALVAVDSCTFCYGPDPSDTMTFHPSIDA